MSDERGHALPVERARALLSGLDPTATEVTLHVRHVANERGWAANYHVASYSSQAVITIRVQGGPRASERAAESQRWAGSAPAYVPDLVAIVGAVRNDRNEVIDWIYRTANDKLIKSIHASRSDVIDHAASQVVPQTWSRVHAIWSSVLESGAEVSYERQHGTSTYWVTVFRIDQNTIGSTALDISSRKQMEADLRQTEEGLNLAIEAANLGTWHAVPGGPLEWSPRAAEMFGVSPDKPVNNLSAFLSMIHADDRSAVQRAIEQSLDVSGDGHYEIEYRNILPDGSSRWIAANGKTRFAEVEGRTVAVKLGGTLMDITERRLAESQLAAETERLKVTLRSIGDAVVAADASGHITLFNQVAEELTGWTSREAVGRKLDEVLQILDVPVDSSRLTVPPGRDKRPSEGPVMVELVARDGQRRPIAHSAAPMHDPRGQPCGVVTVFRDQTAARQAERDIRRSRRELLAIIETLPVGVFVVREARVVYANPMMARYLGYARPSDMVGKAPVDFLAKPREPLGPRSSTDLTWTAGEGLFQHLDGQVVTLETAEAQPIELEGLPALLYVVRDLSEHKKILAALMQSDRLASVGKLASGVAHEINNPLAYLMAGLDFIDQELRSAEPPFKSGRLPDVRQALAEARDGAERVRSIVRDLKTFSRVDAEHRSHVELRHVLDSALRMVRVEIRHRAQLIQTYGDTPKVLANEARLGQVFLNLLLNATQAIPEGHVREHEIRVVTATGPDGQAIVEVHDTGSGMTQDTLERIFDPFFTGKSSRGGAGLGLSVCRNIIDALGGQISVHSTVGQGTTFRVVLPPAPSEVASTKPAEGTPTPGKRRGRVLVIDDEPTVCTALRRALAPEHDVETVTYAPAARERIACGARYDAILCDIMMPDMPGWELHEQLMTLAPDQAERTIFVTGGAFTDRSVDFLDAVPNRRLEKPLDLPVLRSIVRELVSTGYSSRPGPR